MCYWAAGHQLVRFRNPYDPFTILALERILHWGGGARFMHNMPPALFLALPLGFMRESAAMWVWMGMSLAALICAVQMLVRKGSNLHLFAYFFAPAVGCLAMGQMATFVLLGLVVFLRFHKTYPWIAGIGLFLCLLKPLLLIPFGAVFILWSITHREYRIPLTAVALFIMSNIFVMLFDPFVWHQYFVMLHQAVPNLVMPTLSGLVRILIDRNIYGLMYIPATIASVWAVWYFLKNREGWDWNRHGLLVLLVSVWVAPYVWFMDETVLIPAVLAGLYYASENRRSIIPYIVVATVALAEIFTGQDFGLWGYIWTPVAWLVWYLWAQRAPRCLQNVRQLCHD